MPAKIPKACSYPGCPKVTTERYCEGHKKQEARRYDEQRGSAAARGYGPRWRKARKIFLMQNPICSSCGDIATVVDHIQAHKGDYGLFWNRDNWQPLCASCHGRKTVKQDGRWG